MAYGLSTRMFMANGPEAPDAQARRSTARSWRALDERRRLDLVECALKPANDLIDAFPLAL